MICTSWLSSCIKIVLAIALSLSLLELSGSPVLAQGLELWNKNCKKDYKKWTSAANHKAFAVSNSTAGGGNGQSCGSAWKYPTKDAAESAAVKSCESEKQYHSGKCYVMKSE
jgi:hypothetical protein